MSDWTIEKAREAADSIYSSHQLGALRWALDELEKRRGCACCGDDANCEEKGSDVAEHLDIALKELKLAWRQVRELTKLLKDYAKCVQCGGLVLPEPVLDANCRDCEEEQ